MNFIYSGAATCKYISFSGAAAYPGRAGHPYTRGHGLRPARARPPQPLRHPLIVLTPNPLKKIQYVIKHF